MKQIITLSIISLLFLSSCDSVTGSGNIVTEKRSVGNFSGISVGNAFEVEVKIGPVTEVRVEADDNIIKYVETKVSGNTLKIRIDDLESVSNSHLKVYITTPNLDDINASSSADIKVVDIIKGNNKVKFNASSAASIEAEVDAPEVEADASSSGSVTLTGKTRTYQAQASSAGDLRTAGLLSENTEVSVSSGASAHVYASVSLDAEASSGGDIVYQGAASVKQNTSSGGSVNKKD